jgi:hypothetical protein
LACSQRLKGLRRSNNNKESAMAGRFSRSFALARASWSVVSADKELLWLPVFSAIALLLLVGSFVLPAAALGAFEGDVRGDPSAGVAVGAFLFYVLAYFIGIFFNTALVGAAMIRMEGRDPTLRDGLSIASARLGRIFGYALIGATVGLLLRALEQRVGWLGALVVRFIGVGWTLATFLVVPVLVTRDVGPLAAVKESAVLLRKTWGENLIGAAGLALAFSVGYIAVILLAGAGLYLGVQANLPVLVFASVVLGVAAFAVLSALQATMQGVYSAALYRYATQDHGLTPGFPPELLQVAFQPKA